MENVTVIIERNNDGSYTAVPQHKHKIGFIGTGNNVGKQQVQGFGSRVMILGYISYRKWKSMTVAVFPFSSFLFKTWSIK